MSDLMVDMSSLTEDVREKLAELDLELSEGELCYVIGNGNLIKLMMIN